MVRIGSLDPADAAVTLFEGAESSVSYASGHLLFADVVDEILMAQPFDLDARQLKGAAFPLAEHVSWEGSRYGARPLRRTARWCTRMATHRRGS